MSERKMPITSDTVSPGHGAGIVTIGEGTRVTGTIDECKLLDVQGVLEGEAVSEMIVVRNGGGVRGNVQTVNAEIHGVVDGSLSVHEHLEIKSTGDVSGEISYATLAIEKGAKFQGTIQCAEGANEEASAAIPVPPTIPKTQSAASITDEIFQTVHVNNAATNGAGIKH
jgi:cytoskeletal protein CcmA (bactofilin family)